MFITNLFESPKEAEPGYQSEKDDSSTFKLSNLRAHSRITFAHLNRLRMANDIRKFEHEKKLETIQKQYASAPPEGGMGGLGV